MTVLKKNVSLQPGESKLVDFTFTPGEARTYQVAVDGLSGGFVASEVPVSNIELSVLNISPTIAHLGDSVLISVTAWNSGQIAGSRVVVLKVNDVKVAEEEVTLAPDDMRTVYFEVTPSDPGSYYVEVDGLTGSFVVSEAFICLTCGAEFASQEELTAHVQSQHPSYQPVNATIGKLNWGAGEITVVPNKLVGTSEWYIYEVAKGPTVNWGDLFAAWWQGMPASAPPPVDAYLYCSVCKGSQSFYMFGNPYIPYPHINQWGFAVSGFMEASIYPYEDLSSIMPPGVYDIMIRAGANLSGTMPSKNLSSPWYLVRNAWRVE